MKKNRSSCLIILLTLVLFSYGKNTCYAETAQEVKETAYPVEKILYVSAPDGCELYMMSYFYMRIRIPYKGKVVFIENGSSGYSRGIQGRWVKVRYGQYEGNILDAFLVDSLDALEVGDTNPFVGKYRYKSMTIIADCSTRYGGSVGGKRPAVSDVEYEIVPLSGNLYTFKFNFPTWERNVSAYQEAEVRLPSPDGEPFYGTDLEKGFGGTSIYFYMSSDGCIILHYQYTQGWPNDDYEVIDSESLEYKLIMEKIPEESAVIKRMYVNAPEGLRVRGSPGLSGNIIGKLPHRGMVDVLKQNNDTVVIDGISADWFFVRSGDITGWVFGGYLVDDMNTGNVPE